jgi:hypothetical protein
MLVQRESRRWAARQLRERSSIRVLEQTLMNNRARGTLLASILVLGAAGCGDAELRATEVGTQRQALTTADRVLGFESVSTDWALAPGSSGTLSASTQHTEGAVLAQIAGLGWAQLQSTVLIGPLGTTSTNATFDLMVLGSGTIPWGDVVLQVQSSDLAVHEQIGQKLLGGYLAWRVSDRYVAAELDAAAEAQLVGPGRRRC